MESSVDPDQVDDYLKRPLPQGHGTQLVAVIAAEVKVTGLVDLEPVLFSHVSFFDLCFESHWWRVCLCFLILRHWHLCIFVSSQWAPGGRHIKPQMIVSMEPATRALNRCAMRCCTAHHFGGSELQMMFPLSSSLCIGPSSKTLPQLRNVTQFPYNVILSK